MCAKNHEIVETSSYYNVAIYILEGMSINGRMRRLIYEWGSVATDQEILKVHQLHSYRTFRL